MTVAIVIPYFQRAPGVLARALRSVAAQRSVTNIRVIVVDDESPVSPGEEVAAVPLPAGTTVQLIAQRNGGPASARNAALDAIGDDVSHVAFIDSDDEWAPEHLRRALLALSTGHDFYFADLYQLDQSVSAFARAGRIDLARHVRLEVDADLYAFQGDMLEQIITGNVIGTSTVVFRREPLADLRFEEAFLNAGEDYLFWIASARRGARFCFSTAIEATYGKGVNVYSGSGWNTENFLKRVHHEMKYRKHLLRAFELTPATRSFVASCVDDLREQFASGLIHHVRARLPLDRDLLIAQAQLDPMTVLRIPTVAGTAAAQWLKR